MQYHEKIFKQIEGEYLSNKQRRLTGQLLMMPSSSDQQNDIAWGTHRQNMNPSTIGSSIESEHDGIYASMLTQN